MRQWMKKISAILITVLTLGMYIPPAMLPTNAETNKDNLASKSNYDDVYTDQTEEIDKSMEMDVDIQLPSTEDVPLTENDTIRDAIIEQAKIQTVQKLGPRITSQIDTEFMTVILPVMENAIANILTDIKDDTPYIGITEKPMNGYGEKIFTIYDYRTQKDIARFDVRRDNRPQDGYWFNFHYHLRDDDFVKHYEVGDIFWNKNTPPKWMS